MLFDISQAEAEDLLAQYDVDIEIVRKIGRGGQKCVFEARDGTDPVALKILSPDASIDRLTREITVMREVQSDYSVRLRQFRQMVDGNRPLTYLTEDYIGGPSLRSLIDEDAPIPQEEALDLLLKLTAGLVEIWSHSLVHRDIKPGNIMLRENGDPVIVDFGIVRALNLPSLTDSAAPAGPCTPIYASREVLENRKVEINCRADIFSLGVVAYEMLTAEHPFLRDRQAVVPLVSRGLHLSEDLCRTVHRMMHPEPHRRYPSPSRLFTRLQQIRGG